MAIVLDEPISDGHLTQRHVVWTRTHSLSVLFGRVFIYFFKLVVGTSSIVLDKPISDGHWHEVTWSRRYKHMRVVIDGTDAKEMDIQGSQTVLDIGDGRQSIYVHLGGFPYSRSKGKHCLIKPS